MPSPYLDFAGFKSRWMIPCSCAASSASAICFAIGSASSSGNRPLRDAVGERWPLDQLHDEGCMPSALHAVDVDDVRMIQRREPAPPLKPREPIGVVREYSGRF